MGKSSHRASAAQPAYKGWKRPRDGSPRKLRASQAKQGQAGGRASGRAPRLSGAPASPDERQALTCRSGRFLQSAAIKVGMGVGPSPGVALKGRIIAMGSEEGEARSPSSEGSSLARSFPDCPAVLSGERDGKGRGGVAGVAAAGKGTGVGECRRCPGSGRRESRCPREACWSGERPSAVQVEAGGLRREGPPSTHPTPPVRPPWDSRDWKRFGAEPPDVHPKRSARSSRPSVARTTGKGL